ncbi:MAG TPA: alpha/beta hydrolase [Spirochaetota bacterium]|nr:alpha/beta hydrolase [Spirochaetota bacterium]HPI88988.1 alpha/beta hydrolase [Spirochaetota bacterium]HPR47475.1 alpha/beta hydrolase [Spirochaetota bacterium]
MGGSGFSDYALFDRPEILLYLFHPRPEEGALLSDRNIISLSIPVEQNINLGARLFTSSKNTATIIFFHGNGEIVEDYDDIGSLFLRMGINFFPVDYRGYGRSGGVPTVSAMISDSHKVFSFIRQWLRENDYSGPVVVMGRSLGSAPALELAAHHGGEIDALIIESGFAMTVPLLGYLGIDAGAYGITEEKGFRNAEKISMYKGPTLVIHAEKDHIIPFNQGETLYRSSGSDDKIFLKIPEANHNTIFVYGLEQYLKAVADIVKKIMK